MPSIRDQKLAFGTIKDPVTKTASATLTDKERYVLATVPASSSITLTLPKRGKRGALNELFIIAVNKDLGGTSVIVNDDAGNAVATLTAVGDYTVVLNVCGLAYKELASVET